MAFKAARKMNRRLQTRATRPGRKWKGRTHQRPCHGWSSAQTKRRRSHTYPVEEERLQIIKKARGRRAIGTKKAPELAASVEAAAPIAANAVRIRIVHSTASAVAQTSNGQFKTRPRQALPATRLNSLHNRAASAIHPLTSVDKHSS